ncbi:MAG: hypothetical protein C4584_02780, partial [Armatimonadetes bacterium]
MKKVSISATIILSVLVVVFFILSPYQIEAAGCAPTDGTWEWNDNGTNHRVWSNTCNNGNYDCITVDNSGGYCDHEENNDCGFGSPDPRMQKPCEVAPPPVVTDPP